jgi:uncharacterized protein (TIGR03067 family)
MAGMAWAADAPKIEGVWRPTSMEHEGKQMIDADAKEKMTLQIKDSEYRMYWTKDAAKGEYLRLFTGEVSFDTQTGMFEMTIKDGQKKGEKIHGIYELKEGTLKVCYCLTTKTRPTKFESPAGSGFFLETWGAVKK